METGIKSSFIPRDTAAAHVPRARYASKGNALDMLVLLSIVLLVASLALGIGVFVYVKYLESDAASKQEQLKRAEESFDPELIKELNRLDNRMRSGEDLLEKHVAPSALFHTLEALTLDTVSFRTLQFEATKENEVSLVLSGIARSVNSIALQADLFGKHGMITSPIFSNINRDKDGVRFDVSAFINPSTLKFATLIREAAARAEQAAPPPPEGEESSVPLFAP